MLVEIGRRFYHLAPPRCARCSVEARLVAKTLEANVRAMPSKKWVKRLGVISNTSNGESDVASSGAVLSRMLEQRCSAAYQRRLVVQHCCDARHLALRPLPLPLLDSLPRARHRLYTVARVEPGRVQ